MDASEIFRQKRVITQLRTGCYPLGIELGRYRSPKPPVHERICQLCNIETGDEIHLLLKCSDLEEKRKKLEEAMTNRVTGFCDLADGEKVCRILTLSASNFVVYKVVCHLNYYYFFSRSLSFYYSLLPLLLSLISLVPLLCCFRGPKGKGRYKSRGKITCTQCPLFFVLFIFCPLFCPIFYFYFLSSISCLYFLSYFRPPFFVLYFLSIFLFLFFVLFLSIFIFIFCLFFFNFIFCLFFCPIFLLLFFVLYFLSSIFVLFICCPHLFFLLLCTIFCKKK